MVSLKAPLAGMSGEDEHTGVGIGAGAARTDEAAANREATMKDFILSKVQPPSMVFLGVG